MKKKLFILAISALFSQSLLAQNITQVSVDKMNAVLEKVIAAYGGTDRINQLQTMSVNFNDSNFAINQSRRPGPPWDENKSSGSSHIDLEQSIFVTNTKSESPNQSFNNSIIISNEKNYQINNQAKIATPIAQPNFLNTAGPFIRITPIMLVKQLMQRSQASHYLGQVNIDGQNHDVLSLVMEVGPAISLYFDQQNHMLTRSERYMPAFGLIVYRFINYQEQEGIPFNQSFELIVNDEINMKRQNLYYKINQSIVEQTKLDTSFNVLPIPEPAQPEPLGRQEIVDGVYLIGGTGTYALFVEMEDHVIAVGGTAGIPERIQLLKEVLPNKPIKYGVMTHHHDDHILGAQAYADQNITVISAEAHEATIRNATNHPNINFKTIKDKHSFKDKVRNLQLIDIGPTPHSENILVAYLPDESILFAADHFGLQSPGNITPAGLNTQEFAKALKTHQIKATKILSAHSPIVATDKDLAQSLKMAQELNN